ncbi:MAG: hypothetical protein AB2598_18365 [Candidatus Thiodiazotropha sp.]
MHTFRTPDSVRGDVLAALPRCFFSSNRQSQAAVDRQWEWLIAISMSHSSLTMESN